MFTELIIGEKTYKLRLKSRACVELEKRLGKSPLDVFVGMQENHLPKLEDLILIFHAALTGMQANIKLEDAYDIYDEYIEDGGDMMTFLTEVIMDIFKSAGFFKEEQLAEAQEGKN